MSSALEALHAEMLGDVQQLLHTVERTKRELPELMSGLAGESQKAAQVVQDAFEQFHSQSLALAEFIKKRQGEIDMALEASAKRDANALHAALTPFKWALFGVAGLSFINLLVLLGQLLTGVR